MDVDIDVHAHSNFGKRYLSADLCLFVCTRKVCACMQLSFFVSHYSTLRDCYIVAEFTIIVIASAAYNYCIRNSIALFIYIYIYIHIYIHICIYIYIYIDIAL